MQNDPKNESFKAKKHSQISTQIFSIKSIALMDYKNTKPSYLIFRLVPGFVGAGHMHVG